MMYAKSAIKEESHFLVTGLANFLAKQTKLWMIITTEGINGSVLNSRIPQHHCRFYSFFSRMYEKHNLMAFHHEIRHFLQNNDVEIFARLFAIGLPPNSQEMLLERYRPEGRIEVEKPFMSRNTTECGLLIYQLNGEKYTIEIQQHHDN